MEREKFNFDFSGLDDAALDSKFFEVAETKLENTKRAFSNLPRASKEEALKTLLTRGKRKKAKANQSKT